MSPPGSSTPIAVERVTRGTLRKVTSCVATSSQSDEECTPTGSLSGDASSSERGSKSQSESSSGLGSVQSSGSKEYTTSCSTSQRSSRAQRQDNQASSDEATNSKSAPTPRADYPTPVVDEPNRWGFVGQYQVYRDAKILNENRVMTRLITMELRVLTGNLHTIRDLHKRFNLPRFEQMAWDLGTYSDEIV